MFNQCMQVLGNIVTLMPCPPACVLRRLPVSVVRPGTDVSAVPCGRRGNASQLEGRHHVRTLSDLLIGCDVKLPSKRLEISFVFTPEKITRQGVETVKRCVEPHTEFLIASRFPESRPVSQHGLYLLLNPSEAPLLCSAASALIKHTTDIKTTPCRKEKACQLCSVALYCFSTAASFISQPSKC